MPAAASFRSQPTGALIHHTSTAAPAAAARRAATPGAAPPATTLGAYAQLPLFGRLSLVARAENLTGETIVTRNAGGTLDLGTPRTFWAGVRYGF